MRQLLRCERCERMELIALDLPADLCERCLRELGFGRRATEEDLVVLSNAPFLVEEGVTWDEAVARLREEEGGEDD